MLALEIFAWIIFVYGFLSITRDLINEFTYKKTNNNMKIYITLKNVEENIEYFIREIYSIKFERSIYFIPSQTHRRNNISRSMSFGEHIFYLHT